MHPDPHGPPPRRPAGTPDPRIIARRRAAALAALLVPLLAVVLLTTLGSSSSSNRPAALPPAPPRPAGPHPAGTAGDFRVGIVKTTLVDPSRTITLPSGRRVPRTLPTAVRYPALGTPGGGAVEGASPARASGPFPLVVFGHGFAVTPGSYARLLDAWASAGYVVAAPTFPEESPEAAGGPNEADLPNQPTDMRFVITHMLAANAEPRSSLHGLLSPAHIAVAGHSDGGDTALAVAYDPAFRDPRVAAAVILSGAEIPQLGPFTFPTHGPPLLATQGSADTINLPSATSEFFESAPTPKYLLALLEAGHLTPYERQEPQLAIVERVTIAFLDLYLRGDTSQLGKLLRSGSVPGLATLTADR
ncbi:MAG: hypothetical protein FWD42_05550 [Solirubrobacterales bacterium]|nr:hypothetical protein [Solirubrobacterales bacterium]